MTNLSRVLYLSKNVVILLLKIVKMKIVLSKIAIVSLSVFLFISCGKHPAGNRKFDEILNNVETFVDNYPDSAKTILMPYINVMTNVNGCPSIGKVTDEQRARYCLILNTALYKTYTLESDLPSKIAADYYLESNGNYYYKALTYLNRGFVNYSHKKFDRALSDYYSALKIARTLKHISPNKLNFLYFSIYANIGIVYNNQNFSGYALDMSKLAYKYAVLMSDTYRAAIQLSCISLDFYELKQYDSAIYYSNEALKLQNILTENVSYFDVGCCSILLTKCLSFMATDEIDSAYNNAIMAYNMFSDYMSYKQDLSYGCIVLKLGEISLKKHSVDSAKYYFMSLFSSDFAGLKWQSYQNMYEIAKTIDYDSVLALHYYEEAMSNKEKYDEECSYAESQQIKFSNEFQNEMLQAKTKNAVRIMLIVIISSVIIISILIVVMILNRHIQHSLLENEKLKKEVEIYEQRINSLVKELENITEQYENITSNETNGNDDSGNETEVRKALMQTNMVFRKAVSLDDEKQEKIKHVLTEDDWHDFVTYTNLIYNNFVDNISMSNPSLTEWDIRVCCLLKNKFSRKAISSLLGMELKSLYKREYRIKKNKLSNEDSYNNTKLEDILNKF